MYIYIEISLASIFDRGFLSQNQTLQPQILHNLTVYITNEKEREEKKKKSKILDGWPRFIERERKGKKEREKRK